MVKPFTKDMFRARGIYWASEVGPNKEKDEFIIRIIRRDGNGIRYRILASRNDAGFASHYEMTYRNLDEDGDLKIERIPFEDLPLYIGWNVSKFYTALIKGVTHGS